MYITFAVAIFILAKHDLGKLQNLGSTPEQQSTINIENAKGKFFKIQFVRIP